MGRNLRLRWKAPSEQKFTNAIKKIYPKERDILIPFCFICLLHQANEKKLKHIVTNEKPTEFEIKRVEEKKNSNTSVANENYKLKGRRTDIPMWPIIKKNWK